MARARRGAGDGPEVGRGRAARRWSDQRRHDPTSEGLLALVLVARGLRELLAVVSASSTVVLPAITEETSWLILVAKSVNSGMSTNWMPTVGRGWTPGFVGSAPSMAFLVGSANASAALM